MSWKWKYSSVLVAVTLTLCAPIFGPPSTSGTGASSSIDFWQANGSDTPVTTESAAPGDALASKTITVSAGDIVRMEVEADILNNSGAARTYASHCRVGSTSLVTVDDSTSVSASGTNRTSHKFVCTWFIRSSSSIRGTGEMYRIPATTDDVTNTVVVRRTRNSSASDFTGSQTFSINLSTNNTTSTQNALVNGWMLSHMSDNP